MTMQQIELIGGPRDGDILDVPAEWDAVEVPFATSIWHPSLGVAMPEIRKGIYRPLNLDDVLTGRWTWKEPR